MATTVQETRLLNGGIDGDSAHCFVKESMVLNLINMQVAKKNQQAGGDLQFVAGNVLNTVVNALLGSGTNVLIGQCVDEVLGTAYYFIQNSTKRHRIISYQAVTNTAVLVFTDAYVDSGLGWTTDTVICASAADGLLIWADGTDPKYLNLAYDYSVGIMAALLTLITEPPVVPLSTTRESDSSFGVTPVQQGNYQFCWRFILIDGFKSVLSPYSLTSFATRESELIADPFAGNNIKVAANNGQIIPANWKTVEFVVKVLGTATDVATDTYSVIRQWQLGNPDDEADVATGSLVTYWAGTTLYDLSDEEKAKQFDAVPPFVQALIRADNRLWLGNITEGYDMPVVKPTVTITPNTITTVSPNGTAVPMYLLKTKFSAGGGRFPCIGVVVVELLSGSGFYALPVEYGQFRFDTGTQNQFYFDGAVPLPPISVPRNKIQKLSFMGVALPLSAMLADMSLPGGLPLSEQKQIINMIIAAAALDNVATDFDGSATGIFTYYAEYTGNTTVTFTTSPDISVPIPAETFSVPLQRNINILNNANEFATGDEERALLYNIAYSLGVDYYDAAQRKCGNQFLQIIQTPAKAFYGSSGAVANDDIGSFDVSLSAVSGAIPDFSYYFGLTLSRPAAINTFFEYSPNIIRIATKGNDGIIVVGNDDFINNFTRGAAEIYGFAFPISQLKDEKEAYSVAVGDTLVLTVFNTGLNDLLLQDSYSFSSKIIAVQDGFAITYPLGNVVAGPDGYGFQGLLSSVMLTGTVCTNTSTDFNFVAGVSIGSGAVSFAAQIPEYSNQSIASVEINTVTTTEQFAFEIAKFGTIDRNDPTNPQYGPFFDTGTTTTTIDGDCFTQKRSGTAGALTGLSMQRLETPTNIGWYGDFGRITPVDNVGQKTLTGGLRASDTHIPEAATNGYASFNANNLWMTPETGGAITVLLNPSQDKSDGGELLILCERNSYVAPLGQVNLTGGDGKVELTTVAGIIGSINPVTGHWGCQSPFGAIVYQSRAYWADAYKKVLIEYNASGATEISRYGMTRIGRLLMPDGINTGQNYGWTRAFAIDPKGISVSINPFNGEVLFSFPAQTAALDPLTNGPAIKPDLTTTDYSNPIDAFYPNGLTYAYRWGATEEGDGNRWTRVYESGARLLAIGDKVYSFKNGSFYKEEILSTTGSFGSDVTTLYGNSYNGIITIPFTSNKDIVKTPLSIAVLANHAPDFAYIYSDDGGPDVFIATTQPFIYREGVYRAGVLRNRLSNNAANTTEWDNANFTGTTLKGKIFKLVLVWAYTNNNQDLRVTSVSLNYRTAVGQILK